MFRWAGLCRDVLTYVGSGSRTRRRRCVNCAVTLLLSIVFVWFLCVRLAGGAGSGGGSRPELEEAWFLLEGIEDGHGSCRGVQTTLAAFLASEIAVVRFRAWIQLIQTTAVVVLGNPAAWMCCRQEQLSCVGSTGLLFCYVTSRKAFRCVPLSSFLLHLLPSSSSPRLRHSNDYRYIICTPARHCTAKDERQVQPRTPAVGHPVALLGGARLAPVEPGAARGSVAHLRQTGEDKPTSRR